MLELISAAWRVLTSRLAGPIALALALALAVLLTVQGIQLAGAHKDAADLRAQIDAPQTGFRDRLATCTANAGNLEAQLTDQSKQVQTWKTDRDVKLAQASAQVAVAVKGRALAEATANKLAALKGDTCSDFQAADATLLETLK